MLSEQTIVDGLDHPECVIAGIDGYLYAGSERGDIYRIDPVEGSFKVIASTGGFVLGLAMDGSGYLYACDNAHLAVLRISPAGEISTYSTGTADRPMRVPNYASFDASGNLYVSDSGGWGDEDGSIYRISPDGVTEVWTESTSAFPNGLALSSGNTHLYVVESNPPSIKRVEIAADGTAGRTELVIELPGTVPDGIAFDEDANLYISCYRPDVIYRLTRSGALEIFSEDWQGTRLAAPTNVAFGVSGSAELYVANFARWHISRFTTPTSGLPLSYPILDAG